jgi:predicted ArsR family transcriptional regulator
LLLFPSYIEPQHLNAIIYNESNLFLLSQWSIIHGMSKVSFTDLTAEIAVSARRKDVIAKLREAEGPMSVAQLAKETGLHINTARFHLDGLVADGLARRKIEDSGTRGRPRVLYISQNPDGPRSFGLLATLLTAIVASLDDAGEATLVIGRSWGRNLVKEIAPGPPGDLEENLVSFSALLDAIGFEPEIVRSSTSNVEVRLHHCPFREVAELHAEVVCTLHLGLMQGALSQLRAPVEALPLKPFVKPNLCTATLRLLPAIP